MRKLRFFITTNDENETIVKFDEPLIIKDETLTVTSASVFWDYDNITTPIHITYGEKKVWFKTGYWTANMIIEKLKEAKASAELVHYSHKIRILPSKNLSLRELAPLLGYSKTRQRIPKGKGWVSNYPVNINLGMKYVSIKCDAVNSAKTSFNGKRDDSIVMLPITTTQSLKGSVTHYNNINSETKLDNGIYTELKFASNQKVGDILLEITIK